MTLHKTRSVQPATQLLSKRIPNVSTLTALILVEMAGSCEEVEIALNAEQAFQARSAVVAALRRRMRVLRTEETQRLSATPAKGGAA